MLLCQLITNVHNHELHKGLVDLLIDFALRIGSEFPFKCTKIRETELTGVHKDALSFEKLYNIFKDNIKIIDLPIVEFEIFPELLGNFAQCIFALLGEGHFLKENHFY